MNGAWEAMKMTEETDSDDMEEEPGSDDMEEEPDLDDLADVDENQETRSQE
jgi:hypothetical protein